ncbi:hypothetical protein BH10PSE16_BH10PSE16_38920 [soil metagenome]
MGQSYTCKLIKTRNQLQPKATSALLAQTGSQSSDTFWPVKAFNHCALRLSK